MLISKKLATVANMDQSETLVEVLSEASRNLRLARFMSPVLDLFANWRRSLTTLPHIRLTLNIFISGRDFFGTKVFKERNSCD